MKHIDYDFGHINQIFAEALHDTKMSAKHCSDLKRELNKFFRDSNCTNVWYTNNVSKPFFGMIVCPQIRGDIYEYLMGNSNIRLTEYTIEIDSHLFNPILGLKPEEITAVLLHEVGHIVNDTTPIENARVYLNDYMAKNHDTLKLSDSQHYKEILAYALKDFCMKDRSIFYTADVDEVLADDFVRAYGYGMHLEHAMNKILSSSAKMYQGQTDDKFMVFIWTLDLYKHMGYRRVSALRTLNKMLALTGSKIEKAEIDNVIRRVNAIDDRSLLEANFASQFANKIKNRMRKMRIDNMKALEDDYYELNMRIRNVADEDDALYLMRQINTRISLISDFIESEDLSPAEKKRWMDVNDRFMRMRDELSKSTSYANKNYGIFVAYPDIQENRY